MIQLTQAEYDELKRKAAAFDKVEQCWQATKMSEAQRIAWDLFRMDEDKLEFAICRNLFFIEIVEGIERK